MKLFARCLTFCFEPIYECPVVLIPSRTFNNSGTRGKLFPVNESHAEVTYFSAGPVFNNCDACDRIGYLKASVRQVGAEGSSEVPPHIKGLLDVIRINAPPDVREETVLLITQYSDIYMYAVTLLALNTLSVIYALSL